MTGYGIYQLFTKNNYRATVISRDEHEARLIAFNYCKDGWWYAGEAAFIAPCDFRTQHCRILAVEKL